MDDPWAGQGRWEGAVWGGGAGKPRKGNITGNQGRGDFKGRVHRERSNLEVVQNENEARSSLLDGDWHGNVRRGSR